MHKMFSMKTCSIYILLSLTLLSTTSGSPSPAPKHQPAAQFVHEKDDRKHESSSEEQDNFHLTNDLKTEQTQHPFPSWNPYRQDENIPMPRYMNPYNPYSYHNPLFIPYPVFIPPEFLYPFQSVEDYDDMMSRASTRRPSAYRNSPIYYVRLPPTPYMFIPGLGYTSQPPTFAPNFSPVMPISPIPAVPIPQPVSPFVNLPLNFLSNGKPSNVYQLDSNELPTQQPYQPYVPPPPRPYRPQYMPSPNYVQDSKITHLKRPFLFNGRPEDIYVLQGGYNPMYQNPLPGYY